VQGHKLYAYETKVGPGKEKKWKEGALWKGNLGCVGIGGGCTTPNSNSNSPNVSQAPFFCVVLLVL
jgi:hypothetical protein